MGKLGHDIDTQYLRQNSDERALLQPFLFDFDINYARKSFDNRTNLSIFLLSPDKDMREAFGFYDEILLVISDYDRTQPRTIQAIESVFAKQPFRARANPLVFFLISRDPNVEDWVNRYLVDHPQFRTPIPLTKSEATEAQLNKWFVRNKLSTQLFSRDIFDYLTLPPRFNPD